MWFCALYLFAGIAVIWMSARVRAIITQAKSWPVVQGKVLHRDIALGDYGDNFPLFCPVVHYEYQVADRTYRNDQVYSLRYSMHTRDKARRLVESMPDTVEVHYNPEKPEQSCLIINSPAPFGWLMLMGGLAILVGLGQLLVLVVGS